MNQQQKENQEAIETFFKSVVNEEPIVYCIGCEALMLKNEAHTDDDGDYVCGDCFNDDEVARDIYWS